MATDGSLHPLRFAGKRGSVETSEQVPDERPVVEVGHVREAWRPFEIGVQIDVSLGREMSPQLLGGRSFPACANRWVSAVRSRSSYGRTWNTWFTLSLEDDLTGRDDEGWTERLQPRSQAHGWVQRASCLRRSWTAFAGKPADLAQRRRPAVALSACSRVRGRTRPQTVQVSSKRAPSGISGMKKTLNLRTYLVTWCAPWLPQRSHTAEIVPWRR